MGGWTTDRWLRGRNAHRSQQQQRVMSKRMLDQLTRSLRSGDSLDSTWIDSTAIDHERVDPRVAQLLQLGSALGGLRPSFVDAIARSTNERDAIRAEARSLSDQARYSAILLTVGPLGFSMMLIGTDDASRRFLLNTSVGALVVTVALALELLGAWWMRRLVANVSTP